MERVALLVLVREEEKTEPKARFLTTKGWLQGGWLVLLTLFRGLYTALQAVFVVSLASSSPTGIGCLCQTCHNLVYILTPRDTIPGEFDRILVR